MRIRFLDLAAAALTAACAAPACAHLSVEDAIPGAEGVKLGASAALRALSAKDRLPSQGMPGYLLLGDPGEDARGGGLEHGLGAGHERDRA